MDLVGLVLLGVALALAVLVFRLSLSLGWHWAAGLLLGAIPLAATFFFGFIGLLGAALAVGGLYKAAAR